MMYYETPPPLSSPLTPDRTVQYKIARHMGLWSSISFYLAFCLNMVVVFLYPFDKGSNYISEYSTSACVLA